MAQNDIGDVLDHLRRIKTGVDLSSVKIDQIEKLEKEIRFCRTFTMYNHVFLRNSSLVFIKKKAKGIVKMLHLVFGAIPDEYKTNLNLERLESQLLEFIKGNSILRYNYDLSRYMDCLDKNLNDVLMYLELDMCDYSQKNEETLFIKKLKIVQKKMRFLRYLYVSEISGYVDQEKLEGLETRIQFMAENVGKICFGFWFCEDRDETDSEEEEDEIDSAEEEDETDSKEDDDDIDLLCLVVIVELEMQNIFLGELKTSKFSQSRTFKDKKLPKGFSYHLRHLLVYLRKQKHKSFPNSVTARNIDVAIQFLMFFIDDLPNNVINEKRLNEVLAKIGVLVGDILCVVQMLIQGSTIKEDTSKIDLGTIQILEKIEDLKAQVEERYKSLKYSPSNEFPTVGGLSFLDSLLRKLNEMLKSESSLYFIMKPHIGILEKELSSLTFVFRDVAKMQHKHDEILKDLQRRTVNLAYEAEVSIDAILVQSNALWHFVCSLPAIIKEIKHIHAEVTKVRFQNLPLKSFSMVETSKHLQTQHNNPVNDEEIVGFANEAKKIIQYLIRGTNELDIIPIVGMGGQGKTTIVRKIYNNKEIVNHFDRLAWCCISQTYSRIELLKEICRQVLSLEDNVDKDDELADMLRKRLMGRRYLIVLDDMWDVTAWEDLMLSFPNGEESSRIIVTTRLENVGKQIKYHTDPYSLPFLPLDESCKLLQKKVFQQEGCPLELQDSSLAVAKKCKGLPLVIILVAGIIKRNKMEASWWHEVKNSLLSHLGESEDYSLSTMQLSYDNLPDYLKPCLLYMGMFPEDTRIPVSKLMSLWIAECFVQNSESGRLMEEAAESYLMELIHSNLVMVLKREYNGKIKYCQVHDVVLHFCLERSREEKFMLAVKGRFQPSHWKESRVSLSFSNEISKFASLGSKTQKSFHQHLRSLITTNRGGFSNWNIIHKCSKLRLLIVLDLSSHRVLDLSSATLKPLIHLKYLAISTGKFHFHPVSRMPHLQTLIVNSYSKPMLLPGIFWKMEKLRHVEMNLAVFDLENNEQWIFKESSKLENLRILRGVVIKVCWVGVLLWRCPNLQELDISFKGNMYSTEPFCPRLESLTQLQSLHLSFEWSPVPLELHLPSNLKKLVLEGIPVESVISFTAGLPSLEYLRLREWCLPIDIKLYKLKFLKLSYLDTSRWDVSEESFPLLETLVIRECTNLEEIPLSFADILTLKQIMLIGSLKESLEASAVQIKKAVEDTEGCDRIDLITIKGAAAASKDDEELRISHHG